MSSPAASGKLAAPKISRDLVKDAVFTKVERNLELPVILQTLENKGYNDKLANCLGALFDHHLGGIKHRLDKKYAKAAIKPETPGRRNAWKDRAEELKTGNIVTSLDEDQLKEEYLADLKENADIFKRNFKKIAKMIVSDMWKVKNQEVLDQYGDPNANSFQYGSYFYDDYTGPYYYVQEQRRLKKIVQGRMEESILKGRSDAYNSRYQTTDALRISQELNLNHSNVLSSHRSTIGTSYVRPKVG
jgi:hypothetical protein